MIDDLRGFLNCAIRLERDAAEGYAQLATTMRERGIDHMVDLFERMERYSRMHLAEVEGQARALSADGSALPSGFEWPDGSSPETPPPDMAKPGITEREALKSALEVERAACDFYSVVAGQSRSAEVQELAQAFAEEEAGHVDHLLAWLARLEG